MTKQEREKVISVMAKKFSEKTEEEKAIAIMCMTTYIEGKEVGRREEREKLKKLMNE